MFLLIASINGCLDVAEFDTLQAAHTQMRRELAYTVGVPTHMLRTNDQKYELGSLEAHVNNDDDQCSWLIYKVAEKGG